MSGGLSRGQQILSPLLHANDWRGYSAWLRSLPDRLMLLMQTRRRHDPITDELLEPGVTAYSSSCEIALRMLSDVSELERLGFDEHGVHYTNRIPQRETDQIERVLACFDRSARSCLLRANALQWREGIKFLVRKGLLRFADADQLPEGRLWRAAGRDEQRFVDGSSYGVDPPEDMPTIVLLIVIAWHMAGHTGGPHSKLAKSFTALQRVADKFAHSVVGPDKLMCTALVRTDMLCLAPRQLIAAADPPYFLDFGRAAERPLFTEAIASPHASANAEVIVIGTIPPDIVRLWRAGGPAGLPPVYP